jgi:hypothetical protein
MPWVGRRTRLQQRTRRRDEAERRRLGRGGKLGASEAVMVESPLTSSSRSIACRSHCHHGVITATL